MIPVSTTEMGAMKFDIKNHETSQRTKVQSNKIGWLHIQSDKPGVTFDLAIKDALGRVRAQKLGCHTDTKQYGELLNLNTMIGEEVEVEVTNVKNADTLHVHLN